jgi:uncharacterized protein (TIGR02391 family)
MNVIIDVFPPYDVAINLEPEELAVHVIECLSLFKEQGNPGMLHRGNFTSWQNFQDYCQRKDQYGRITEAASEAWMWLEREGLIAPKPGQEHRDVIFITRRGRKFRESGDINKFKTASLLPPEKLDPTLVEKVRPAFLRGDYDSAIFEAFKEVEIRVRNLSGGDKTDIGVTLMRKAFHPETGPLTDKTQVSSERQAIGDLFAGCIGSFKNPSSHRDVDFTDPSEVVELIMLADQLIRIGERRKTLEVPIT